MFSSKVDWWVPVVVVFSVACCFVGPMIDGDYVAGIVLAAVILVIETVIFAGVKYQIRGDMLGVRNFFRWTWFPIDKIAEIRAKRDFLSAPALSFDRLAITFTDRSILKSSMPLEISPKDKAGFIALIKSINPNVKTS